MIDQRWTTIDGRSWRLTNGDWMASIMLGKSEKGYYARINDLSASHGTPPIMLKEFNCLKKAKAACIKRIAERLHQEDVS